MKNEKTFYVTTAIDYVNGAPHLGHAYEKICTDIIARWHKLLSEDVFFLTGTDENAQKNVQAAKEAGIPIKEFGNLNAKSFIKLCKVLNISNNDFIRTTEQRHIKVIQKIFNILYKKGEIYKKDYEGLYCYGCEAFKTEKDLVDDKCPEHPTRKIVHLKEEAYFFKMSKYEKQVLKALKQKKFVFPEKYKNQVLSRIEYSGLKDLCVSRLNLDWGIPVPFDKKHKIYVWIDALSNYISALGWPNDKKFKKYWPAVHVLGKDVVWFHSVIWPSILLALKVPLPKMILVHGFINISGEKLSKSEGNIIDPFELAKKYSTDPLRYFIARQIPFGDDGDFSEKFLADRHNNELANKLGNLILRVSALAEKYGIKNKKSDNKLFKKLKLKKIERLMENFDLDKALNLIFEFIDACNGYIQEKKPWETHDKKVLYELADSIRIIAILLWPFIPETSEKIAKQFKFEIKSIKECKPGLLKICKIKKSEILFKKIK